MVPEKGDLVVHVECAAKRGARDVAMLAVESQFMTGE